MTRTRLPRLTPISFSATGVANDRGPRARLGRRTSWYRSSMVRTLDLVAWAGRWVALDEHDRVMRDAETLKELITVLEADGIEGVSIMRAPVPGEPVVYGLG